MAEEFKLTLSAPALKRSLIEETESIPPPTVNGIFTDFAVLETRSTNVQSDVNHIHSACHHHPLK